MLKALPKYLGLALLTTAFSLGGCRSTILHKDGMREAVTQPLIESIEKQGDKLQLDKLVASTNETMRKLGELIETTKGSAEVSKVTLSKLSDTLTELTQLLNKLQSTADASNDTIKAATSLIKQTETLVPELRKIAENVNGILPDAKETVANVKAMTAELKDTIREIRDQVKVQTTESLLWKILPAAVIALGLLIAVLIIISALKKKHDQQNVRS